MVSNENVFEAFITNLKDIVQQHDFSPLFDDKPENYIISSIYRSAFQHCVPIEELIKFITPELVFQHINERMESISQNNRIKPRIIVAPCSILFDDCLMAIKDAYPDVVFVDKGRAGEVLYGTEIVSADSVTPLDTDICLMITRNYEASLAYREKWVGDNNVDFFIKFFHDFTHRKSEDLVLFQHKLQQASKPIVFASLRPMATKSSTILALKKNGYSCYWYGPEHIKEDHEIRFSTPKVESLNVDDFCVNSLMNIMPLAINMDKGAVFFHYEDIYPPIWDFKRSAICYAVTLAMVRTISQLKSKNNHSKFCLYMYDAIKPANQHYEAAALCSHLFKAMIAEAEGVIISSFTEEIGDLFENAIGQKINRVHHHRYQYVNTSLRQPRRTDGIHIAIVSLLLEEMYEPSRAGLVDSVRDIIEQGFHVHYYTSLLDDPTLAKFKQSLSKQAQCRFHLHKPIHDLDRFIHELSQYHLGWSLFNMQVFNDMTTYLDDPFMRDAMDLFTPTTLPSVIWSCATAGLPVICNRSMTSVQQLLPDGMTMPLSISELPNLKNIVKDIDWIEVDKISLECIDMKNHINKLCAFLEQH